MNKEEYLETLRQDLADRENALQTDLTALKDLIEWVRKDLVEIELARNKILLES